MCFKNKKEQVVETTCYTIIKTKCAAINWEQSILGT
jgi:hypothetical protein